MGKCCTVLSDGEGALHLLGGLRKTRSEQIRLRLTLCETNPLRACLQGKENAAPSVPPPLLSCL